MKALVIAALLVVGCGASHRRTVIGGTVAALDAGQVTLQTYAHAHTEELIKASTSADQARSEVAAFRAKVDKAEADIAVGYRLAAIAGSLSDDQSLANLIAVAKLVKDDFVAMEQK